MSKHADEISSKVKLVIAAIREKHGIDNKYIPPEDIYDTMPCPVCNKGIVTYTISSWNGHRSAQCSEKNCFGHYIE